MHTNIEQATISSLNINQEGLDTTIVTTTNYEHNEIKPDYTAIATGAAVTGFIAGVIVTGEALLTDSVGVKPTGETSQLDYAVLKPDPSIAGEGFTGVVNPDALNVGLSNLTTDPTMVGVQMLHLTLPEAIQLGTWDAYSTWFTSGLYEGGWLMKPIEQTIGGMHYMSLFHDQWATQAGFEGAMVPITIIPAIPATYCTIATGSCAGVTSSLLPSSNARSSINQSRYKIGVNLSINK